MIYPKAVLQAAAFVCGFTTAVAQENFQNLGFEMAQVPAAPSMGLALSSVLPHWQGVSVHLADFGAAYDTAALDLPLFGVFDANPGPDNAFFPKPIFGVYSAFLVADWGVWPASQNKVDLFQSGLVPADAKSIRFATTADPIPSLSALDIRPQDWRLSLSLNGQTIPYVALDANTNYVLWAADVSGFAGASAELRFSLDTHLPNELSPISDYSIALGLDGIEFSPQAIPEPGTVMLLGLAAVVWRVRGAQRRHV